MSNQAPSRHTHRIRRNQALQRHKLIAPSKHPIDETDNFSYIPSPTQAKELTFPEITQHRNMSYSPLRSTYDEVKDPDINDGTGTVRFNVSADTDLEYSSPDPRMHGVDSKLLEELNEDNIDENIITEEINKLTEEFDLRAVTWRQRMVHFLHTTPVELFLMSLVIIDVIIILVMVVLDIYIIQQNLNLAYAKGSEIFTYLASNDIPKSHLFNKTTDINSVYKKLVYWQSKYEQIASTTSGISGRTKRAASGHFDRGDFGSDETYKTAKLMSELSTVNYVLHIISIIILSVFVIEVILKVIGYGKHYLKTKMEVLDGCVILISFALDAAIMSPDFTDEVGKTILIVFLMWRVIRILNAMVLTSRARTMFRLKLLRKAKKIGEDKNRHLVAEAADYQAEINKLRLIAKRHGAEEHELQAAVALSKTSFGSTHVGLKTMMAQLVHLNTKIASTGIALRSSAASAASVSCSVLNCSDSGDGRRGPFSQTNPSCRKDGLLEMRQRSVSDAAAYELKRDELLTTPERHSPAVIFSNTRDSDSDDDENEQDNSSTPIVSQIHPAGCINSDLNERDNNKHIETLSSKEQNFRHMPPLDKSEREDNSSNSDQPSDDERPMLNNLHDVVVGTKKTIGNGLVHKSMSDVNDHGQIIPLISVTSHTDDSEEV